MCVWVCIHHKKLSSHQSGGVHNGKQSLRGKKERNHTDIFFACLAQLGSPRLGLRNLVRWLNMHPASVTHCERGGKGMVGERSRGSVGMQRKSRWLWIAFASGIIKCTFPTRNVTQTLGLKYADALLNYGAITLASCLLICDTNKKIKRGKVGGRQEGRKV